MAAWSSGGSSTGSGCRSAEATRPRTWSRACTGSREIEGDRARPLEPGDSPFRTALEADGLTSDEAANVRGHRLEGAGAANLLELEPHGLRRAATRAHPEHHATRSQLL